MCGGSEWGYEGDIMGLMGIESEYSGNSGDIMWLS